MLGHKNTVEVTEESVGFCRLEEMTIKHGLRARSEFPFPSINVCELTVFAFGNTYI